MCESVVTVEQGQLQGKICTNLHNKNFYSFQGIPYAKPPVGNLRFRAPQPPEPWTGVRDATIEGSECYSRDMILQNLLGSEDCLFLNVYTPELPTEKNKLKPVMVWIHGGAFRSGSSKTDVYGPEYILTEDVVLVTINYRTGILGFLQMPSSSSNVPGNAGLKDMVMALKWVQKNIETFSGDPNNVTIFGESAGAASVHYLVLSPLAKGLFHKAIAQSGCALNPFARGRDDIITHLANEFKTSKESEILQQLMSLPVEKLHELSEKIANICESLQNSGGKIVFAPLLEKPSEEAFISEEPLTLIKSGKYNHVPLIFGYTTREGMLMEMMIKPRKPTMPSDFESQIPHNLKVERGSAASKDIANKIKQFYYGEPGCEDNLDNFYLIHGDNYFLRDIIFAAQHHAVTSKFPVYLYQMSIETSLNLFKNLLNIPVKGVCHGDDIGYLFKTKLSPQIQPGSLEEVSIHRFVKFWTSFARNGNPNSKDIANAPEWKPVSKDEINFVDIGEQLTANVNPIPERMKFWTDIFNTRLV